MEQGDEPLASAGGIIDRFYSQAYLSALDLTANRRGEPMNKIVARFADGRILKGYTSDFAPNKRMFHMTGRDDQTVQMVNLDKLKALFIVREFEGNPEYRESSDFDETHTLGYGSRLKVVFKDGEEFIGVGTGYNPDRIGFFITPCDPGSNTIRAFVINDFVDHMEKL